VFGLRMLAVKNSTKRRLGVWTARSDQRRHGALDDGQQDDRELVGSVLHVASYSSSLMNDKGRYNTLNKGRALLGAVNGDNLIFKYHIRLSS